MMEQAKEEQTKNCGRVLNSTGNHGYFNDELIK